MSALAGDQPNEVGNIPIGQTEAETPEPTCLDESPECSGTVEYRTPLSGTGRSFPRCEHHWSKRLDAQDGINRRYGGSAPPSDFDPSFAGESWDED